MLPDFIRRRFIIRKESVRPNEKRNPILKFFLDDTTLKRIASAVVADGNEVSKSMNNDMLYNHFSSLNNLNNQAK